MSVVEVFADVACPFTHVGLERFVAYRREQGRTEPLLAVRAWPLELVNGQAHSGRSLTPKVEALCASVAPDLFAGFDEDGFPTTTLPAMTAVSAAYRQGLEVGEQFSLGVRRALFEEGLDVSDENVLRDLRQAYGVPPTCQANRTAVLDDLAAGKGRGVIGSPHFFTADGNFFCPSLDIEHGDDGYQVTFDPIGFQRFLAAAFD